MIQAFALILSLLLPASAWAQTPSPGGVVLQSGTITPQHATRWVTNGVISDAGGAAGATVSGGNYLTEMGITNTGTPFCINDALTSSTSGYHQLCLGADVFGGGILTYNAEGSAAPLPFNCIINGTTIPNCLLNGTGGNVFGPSSSITNDIATFADTTGRLLKDAAVSTTAQAAFVSQFAGYDPTGTTDSTAALQACVNAAGSMGTCWVNKGATLEILGNVTIPRNTTLKCSYSFSDDEDANTGLLGSTPAIKLSSASSFIAGGESAWIANCLIYRNGMTFPAANSSAFAGIAITDNGVSGLHVTDSEILGFDTAIRVTGARPYIVRNYLDGTGITHAVLDIENGNHDSGYIGDIKIQPIATGNFGFTGSCTASQRAGTGANLGGINFINGNIISQNFLTQDFLISGLALVNGSIWSDGIQNICGGTAIGINLTGNLESPLVNVNSTQTGLVINTSGGENWIGILFANTIGQDCLSITTGDTRIDSFYTNNANATGNCGRYAIELTSTAVNDFTNIGFVFLGGVNGNVVPYIHNDSAVSTLGRALQIGQLVTNLALGQNPYGGFLGASGADWMMANLPLSLGSCSGLGGGTCTLIAGSDALQGAITLSPSGVPAATGVIPITFPIGQASGRYCSFTPAGGTASWPAPAGVQYTGTSITTLNATWSAGAALSAGSTYLVGYRCSVF